MYVAFHLFNVLSVPFVDFGKGLARWHGMMRLVLSKTGHEAEGGWRPMKGSHFPFGSGGPGVAKTEGESRAVFLQMWLNPVCATAAAHTSGDLGLYFYSF